MDVEMNSGNSKPQQEVDLYTKMKELQSELEILSIQEEYLKDEQRHLKSEYIRSKEEVSYLEVTKFVDQENSIRVSGHWKLHRDDR